MAVNKVLIPGGASGITQYDALRLDDTNNNVGIGADPNSKALLDLSSTTKGFRKPQMTTAQRDAISSPSTGLEITNTDVAGTETYNGTRWQRKDAAAGTPTFNLASGWGTGSSSSITGNDLQGKISITSGTGSLTATNFGTVTFNKAFPTGADYAVFFHAANDKATEINTYLGYAGSKSVSSFVEVGSSGLASRLQNSTTYEIYYHVIQYQ